MYALLPMEVNTSHDYKDFNVDKVEGKEVKPASIEIEVVDGGGAPEESASVAVQPGDAVQRDNRVLCLLKSIPSTNGSIPFKDIEKIQKIQEGSVQTI